MLAFQSHLPSVQAAALAGQLSATWDYGAGEKLESSVL